MSHEWIIRDSKELEHADVLDVVASRDNNSRRANYSSKAAVNLRQKGETLGYLALVVRNISPHAPLTEDQTNILFIVGNTYVGVFYTA